jgi:hypothetical protein
VDGIDFDKELAPVAKHLVSGKSEEAVLAITASLTKFLTGSTTLAGVAEKTLAKAIAKSSSGKLQQEYRELAKEEQEKRVQEHLKLVFGEVFDPNSKPILPTTFSG